MVVLRPARSYVRVMLGGCAFGLLLPTGFLLFGPPGERFEFMTTAALFVIPCAAMAWYFYGHWAEVSDKGVSSWRTWRFQGSIQWHEIKSLSHDRYDGVFRLVGTSGQRVEISDWLEGIEGFIVFARGKGVMMLP